MPWMPMIILDIFIHLKGLPILHLFDFGESVDPLIVCHHLKFSNDHVFEDFTPRFPFIGDAIVILLPNLSNPGYNLAPQKFALPAAI